MVHTHKSYGLGKLIRKCIYIKETLSCSSPNLGQHSSTMKMAWGVAVMLILAAASVRADYLYLEMMQDELLGGEYYPDYSNISWYIKFSAKVEGEDIVSVCEILGVQGEYLGEVTALKIPYRNKHTSKIDHMHTRVITAAKATAQVLKLSHLLPSTVDNAYWNMADCLAADMENSQVHFAVMYHAIIIRAALRIMNSARKTKDICQVSPDYEYTESSSLFICAQDLPHFSQSLLPNRRQKRRINCGDCDSSQYRYGRGLCGHDWGCCGKYNGCCHYAHIFCYLHNWVCRCCKYWICDWQCVPDPGC